MTGMADDDKNLFHQSWERCPVNNGSHQERSYYKASQQNQYLVLFKNQLLHTCIGYRQTDENHR